MKVNMKAGKLKVGDYCKVYFTDSVCEVARIDYDYGRTSIILNYYEDGIYQRTDIAPHQEVELVK